MDSETSSSQQNSFVSQSSTCDISESFSEEEAIDNNTDSAIHFSGIGEDVPYLSGAAISRACSLKYESDCFSLEDIFTSEDYKNLTPEQVLVSLIPLVEKYDISSLWYVFKTVVEKRMASIPFERLVLETEWLKDPTVRLAKILCFLPIKKMPSFMLGHLHMSDQDCLFLDSMQGYIDIDPPSSLTIESEKNDQSSNNGHEIANLLLKIEELQHKTATLINENSLVQELLSENGKKLEAVSEENLHLRHQLLRAKIELKEIDDLTTEVWSLRAKITSYKRSEKKKREKLKEIEEQNDILFKRALDIEGKVDHWHAVVQDAKKELIAMKNLVCSHEKEIILAVQETTMTQIQLDEVKLIKSELENSVKELIEANEALRSDKRILENNLAEIKFLLSKNDGGESLNNLSCENIFCEDDSFVAEDEGVLNASDCHISVPGEARVSTDHQKSIEVKSGSTLLQKSLAGSEDNAKVCHSSDVQDQINAEIRALREQLVRSQVLFSYLLKDGSTDHTSKSLDCKTHLRTLLEEGNLGDVIYQCKSFDGQVPARFYNRSNRSSSSYASHRSTPMHCGYTSLSCPTLPIESPVVTKSTQTEPMSGVTFYMRTGTNGVCSATSSNSLSKGNVFFSPPSTPCETAFEPLVLTDVCEVHHEPDDHSFPRHRTNSFLSAVKEGNSKLIDATSEFSEKMKELDGSLNYMERKLDQIPSYTEDGKTEFFVSTSISKALDSEGKHLNEENKECTYPRKLSILLEEDYEDASGNYFSVCSSQPFLNRKKKLSPSCNVKTQTDLSISSQPQPFNTETPPSKTLSDDLPVKEFCLPRHGYSIVTAAIQKKTVYSEELPHKLILRHPPPYTKHHSKSSSSMPSSQSYFLECHLKSKTQMYKWATVAESLPSKSEYSHNLTPKSRHDSNLQTRHLSLEKQESFSSCDHSLYPDSQMSSITDCSAWMTKSDVELNARPDPPSYQQTVLATYRNQSARNRWAWKYVTLVVFM